MANITRFNPISPIEDMFDELTRGFFVRPLSLPRQAELQIKLDVKEDEKAYKVRADIPGVKEREEKQGEKTLYSERSYGMVSRQFDLPSDVDPQACRAEYKDGVLNLVLPKKNGGSGRRLSVT